MHLGIDLGGTKTEVAVLDNNNTVLLQHRVPSPQHSYQATLDNIIALILHAETKLNTCCTVGIGIPGSISPTTRRIQNANSTWLIGHDLKTDIERGLNRPIAIANDADCFTLSEACDGVGHNKATVFGVILGTGVGGGITVNRQIISGPNAITGEWGHNIMPVPLQTSEHSSQCYCGQRHCIETYLSGPALVKRFNQQTKAETPDINSVEQLLAQQDSDATAALTLSNFYEGLTASLAQVINILDPECVVLGGGLSNIDAIYTEIPKRLQKYVFSENCLTPILKAAHGDSSGVRGAAWLGKQTL